MLSYEIKKGIKTETLKHIVDCFDADCKGNYNFYGNAVTYPIYNPVYTHVFRLDFTFPFETDEKFDEEFINLLEAVDIWEAR